MFPTTHLLQSHPTNRVLKYESMLLGVLESRQDKTIFLFWILSYFCIHGIAVSWLGWLKSTNLQFCRCYIFAILKDNAGIRLLYTACLKKGTPTLSIVTLRRINGFWRFLAQIFLTQLAIKWYFKFPPHQISVSTLPGENRTNEILHFIQGSIINLLK